MYLNRSFWIMVVAALLAFPAVTLHSAEDSWNKKAEAMKKSLEKKGFTVSPGKYQEVNLGTLYCAGLADSCNGNNFNAPYHGYLIPTLDRQPPSFYFKMRRDEAIVIVGPTPPTCRFYSWALFVFKRWDAVQQRERELFDTLGQPLNRYLVHTGGSPFNQNIVLTFTCDQKVDQAVRDAAKAAGFSGDVLNTYVVPSSILRTNDALDNQADVLFIGQREALVTGTPSGAETFVWRVTPPSPTPAAQLKPFPAPDLRVRGTGKTEMDWTPAVETLRESILATYPGQTPQEYTTVEWVPQSPMAIQSWENSVGDTSDAAYLSTKENFKLSDDPGDFLVAYGVNHTKTEKALYTNLTVYTSCKMCGVASVFSDSLDNTASDYLKGTYPFDPGKLYAYKIARSCNGDPHCLTVPTSEECGKGSALADDLFVSMRNYLETKTKTGPSYTELVFDRVMHFTASPPQVESLNTTFSGPYPGPVPVTLHATSSTPGDLRWRVSYEYMDDPCCGALEPKDGLVESDGSINFSFTPDRAGTFYLEVTVADAQDRQTCGEVKIVAGK